MFRFLKPVRGLALTCCGLLILFLAIEATMFFFSGRAIDTVREVQVQNEGQATPFRQWLTSDEPHVVDLRQTLLLWTICVALLLALRYIREVMNSRFSMEGVYYIREAVYDKLQRVGMGFHDATSSGQLINRALSDLQNVRAFIQTSMMQALEIVVGVPIAIGLIAFKNPWLGCLALLPLPFWAVYILRFSKRVQPAAKLVMEAEDRNVNLITENIAGVQVVKAFATEQAEIAKYNANADEFIDRVLKRIRLFANFHPVIRGIASASHLSLFLLAAVLIVLSRDLASPHLKIGDLVVLGSAMSAALARLQGIAGINEQYQNAIVSARRLHEVLAAPHTVPEQSGARPLPKGGGGEVVFEHVHFGYSAEKDVLHDIHFRVPAGSVVAIVGPTGAGKSTLVNLIARFYDVERGRILIDGVDVRDATLDSIRTQVSFVFQETYLFSDTVAANIAYGRPGVTAGDIEAAARLAQAHDFIEAMPNGYGTFLVERGTNLSGGQRQRMAIARAIVTNPRVLILDDATAAVDSETEDLIRRGMSVVMAGRTTFIIAHRISTVKRADVVLVIEEGRITQQGTHADLMARDGHYREVARAQLSPDDTAPLDPQADPSHVKRMRDEETINAVAAASAKRPLASESE